MEIKYEINNDNLVFQLSGRIDATNASAVDADVEKVLADNKGNYSKVTIDGNSLEYISSAGLRVILKLLKAERSLSMINLTSEVYEIFEMTGFTDLMSISKGYKRISVDGCKVIGKGAKGTIYRYDSETVVKAYNNPECLDDILNERKLARTAFIFGIPTAISYDVVKVNDSYGSVFELLEADSYSDLIKNNSDDFNELIKEYTDLIKIVHSNHPNYDDFYDYRKTIQIWLDTDKPYLSEETNKKLQSLLDKLPKSDTLLHSDYHTNNVMKQNDEALLIDMDTISIGHPIYELANIYVTYVGFGEVDPSFVENFIGLPYDTTKKIWKTFLPMYLDTTDEIKITEVEDKIKLLGYCRYMRHFVRKDRNCEESKIIISYCNEKINSLIDKVDSLDF